MKKCKHDETTVEDLFRKVAVDRLERIERILTWDLIRRYNMPIKAPDISDILPAESKPTYSTGWEKLRSRKVKSGRK